MGRTCYFTAFEVGRLLAKGECVESLRCRGNFEDCKKLSTNYRIGDSGKAKIS